MRKTALFACALLALAAVADPADWKPDRRWRGFNLLGMFMKREGVKPQFEEWDFATIRKLGFDFARLPLDYRHWTKNGDWNEIDPEALAPIDRALEYGKKHSVHVMICFHRAPGYTVAAPPEPKSLFTDEEALAACERHWRFFARRYRGIPNERLSFNLFNEPAHVSETDYARVARRLVAAIREEDPSRFILADGLDWGNRPVPSLAGIPGVGQGARGYAPFPVTHYLAPWAGAPSAKPVWPPEGEDGKAKLRRDSFDAWEKLRAGGTFVMANEFGVWNHTPHDVTLRLLADYIAIWDETGMSWALWEFRGAFGIFDSGRSDVKYEEFDGHLLDRKMLDVLIVKDVQASGNISR